MAMKMVPTAILISITGVAFFAGILGVSKTINKPAPPPVHEIREVSIVPETVYPDATGIININVTNSTKRTVDCPVVRVFRHFSDSRDQVIYTVRQVGGRLKASPNFANFTNYLQLPASAFPPGEYNYDTIAFSRCPDGNTYTALSETATFTVVPRKD